MRKQTITFESPLEALVAVAKRLSRYETETGMDSADFFTLYEKGESDDDAQSVDWANDWYSVTTAHRTFRIYLVFLNISTFPTRPSCAATAPSRGFGGGSVRSPMKPLVR